ncbi:DUF2599 domain-containing protein [Bacillus sp. CD3-1a]|uniref:DUF2599 domain-containing protein n=1 Tax=Bacillus sp. CD3-1a TaxID=2587158 RepID=UPI001124AB35|nr:DUF2599 domain-containing protein [Bacillus sp. CD3-1a]MDA2474495.1 DUF2599 domain-containing protein [Bacillus cereus]TNO92965.1 DUF2599 domain-containing protein [Bacillus sp. CD3-1a]
MKKKLLSISLAIPLALSVFPSLQASAETDNLGYEYQKKKSSEIDFTNLDQYPVLLEGEPTNPDAVYAVYESKEIDKFERDNPLYKPISGSDVPLIMRASAPTSWSSFYSSGSWITRDGVISLSLYPKSPAYVKSPNPMVQAHHEKYRWSVVYNRFSGDKRWKNTGSMKAQLHCHADYAKGHKTPWNLEPHRTTTNYQVTVANACNPK